MLESKWTKMEDSLGTTWNKIDEQNDIMLNIHKDKENGVVYGELFHNGNEIECFVDDNVVKMKSALKKAYDQYIVKP